MSAEPFTTIEIITAVFVITLLFSALPIGLALGTMIAKFSWRHTKMNINDMMRTSRDISNDNESPADFYEALK
jgi:hypothetical protein